MTESDNKQNSVGELKSEKLTTLLESVERLYHFRDHYFENHSEKDAYNKVADVKKKLEETLILFEENKDVNFKERAQYFYLKGKALNVTPNYDPKAEEALSRAIKLDIKLYDAWNELGESYWKKEDIAEAKNCFQGALKHCKNKKSLRNLSMVTRMKKPSKFEDRIKNVEDGVKFAKEAVELDPSDGTSWSVLGNAYLSSFFNIAQYPSVLNLCKSAYTQAEKDIIAKSNPDLHYNKAIVAKYEEDYTGALNSFAQAHKLEPTWEEPKHKEIQLIGYLTKVNELYKEKGKIKGKKLYKMLNNLNPEKNLGPYKGGKYKAKNGQEIKLIHTSFSELKEGLNEEKVVLGVVVCSIQDEDNVPFTFVMVDKNESCLVVTVYNLAQEKGVLIGDYVAIPEPYLTSIHIKFEDKGSHSWAELLLRLLVTSLNLLPCAQFWKKETSKFKFKKNLYLFYKYDKQVYPYFQFSEHNIFLMKSSPGFHQYYCLLLAVKSYEFHYAIMRTCGIFSEFFTSSNECSFRSVRVVSPLVMVVNGKKLDKSKQSGLQLSTFALAD